VRGIICFQQKKDPLQRPLSLWERVDGICVGRGAAGAAPVGLTLGEKRSHGFSTRWQLWQELLPCHRAVPARDTVSAAPTTPTVAFSPALAAVPRHPRFNGGSEAFATPADAQAAPAASQEQPQGRKGEEHPVTAPRRRRKGWNKAHYHVGLPAIYVNTAVNAPPEVILRLPLPGKHGNT